MSEAPVRVAAAIVERADGQVLLAQRPTGKAYAGYWEFPGGKLERGETPRDALDRELAEELGITVRRAAPWLVQRYRYPHAHVQLHFFRVLDWSGEPVGHDGQAFVWQTPGRFDVAPLLPANTVVLRALSLPRVYGDSSADTIKISMTPPPLPQLPTRYPPIAVAPQFRGNRNNREAGRRGGSGCSSRRIQGPCNTDSEGCLVSHPQSPRLPVHSLLRLPGASDGEADLRYRGRENGRARREGQGFA